MDNYNPAYDIHNDTSGSIIICGIIVEMQKTNFILYTFLALFCVVCGTIRAQDIDTAAELQQTTAEASEQEGDDMVLIPAGMFIMGTDDENAQLSSRPAHRVELKSYRIDRYEVTNAQYAECVAVRYCTEPHAVSSATREDYYANEDYANYPVIHVDWNQANAYCSWAGKRLPTEAEWEKAARGTGSYIYPWGNDLPEELPMQVNQFGTGDTVPVDSFPDGISPYGVYNMAGNVWEWTADQFDQYYYGKSPAENPKSVTGGVDYVIRGYSWAYPFSNYQITARSSYYVLNHTYDLGFRCAKDE